MALEKLRLWRLLIFVPFMAACFTAGSTKEQGYHHEQNASATIHNFPNRSVILNRASEHYLTMIFQEYSDNLTGRISTTRFNDLLHDLSLGQVVVASSQGKHSTYKESQQHKRHTRSNRALPSVFVPRSSGKQTRFKGQNFGNFEIHRQRRDTGVQQYTFEKCLEERKLMSVHKVDEKEGLSEDDFVRICPSLIHQLRGGVCNQDKEPNSNVEERIEDNMLHVWGYGLLSITIISLASLLAIAILPFLGRSFYKKLMSFLVALAVGTLAGDALLHLIPHAFHDGEEEGGAGHKTNVFKSCVIMAGIYVFFLLECVLKARLSRKEQTRQKSHACDDVAPPEEMSLRQKKKYAEEYEEMIGSRLAGIQRRRSCDAVYVPNVRISFSGSCEPTACGLEIESGKEERTSNSSESSQEKALFWRFGQNCHQRDKMSETGKHSFSDTELVNEIRCSQGTQYQYPVSSETTTPTTETTSTSNDGDQSGSEAEDHEDYHDDHQHHKRNHHHHHSHNIDKSTSIATVAWMVILGDGFHNFSDGLAVGAAFSASLTSGLTTSIAVFCHELPHELGDFAILLKSGLTFRQAVTYNFASAIISFIGLVLGIIIGDIESAHSWVLALTAGMFLYVSLVDMLPELSNYIQEGGGWSLVLSQNLGMLTGVFIMLIIALYEHHTS